MTLIKNHYRAGYPAVAIETVEENRCVKAILAELPEDSDVFGVDACGHLFDARAAKTIEQNVHYPKAFGMAVTKKDTVLIVFDWQHVCNNPGQYRALKTRLSEFKAHGCMAILIAPSWKFPPELRHDIPILRMGLPSRDQLRDALGVVTEAIGNGADGEPENAEVVLDGATGLTLEEAENAFALAASKKGVCPDQVIDEKMRLVRASGHLEVSSPIDPKRVGGLDNLKAYVSEQIEPWRGHPVLAVKGVLLVGVPGTGKSLSAKAIAALLELPLLRLDVGSLMGGIVGESEHNMQAALDVADAIAPCVLWIDEIEKGVGGYQSSARTDGGTTLRMLGRFLTWMQEHTSEVVVVATCNDFSALPAELTRPGRFSERFFVDCPTATEREAIAAVHLKRVGGDLDDPKLPKKIAELTADWTGAEIEELVISSARTNRDIKDAAKDIRPMCKVRGDEIAALRDWGNANLRRANADKAAPKRGRRVRS